MTDMPDHILWTTAEVCAAFRITPRTLYGWIRRGRLPAIRVAGEFRFNRNDVLALMQPAKRGA